MYLKIFLRSKPICLSTHLQIILYWFHRKVLEFFVGSPKDLLPREDAESETKFRFLVNPAPDFVFKLPFFPDPNGLGPGLDIRLPAFTDFVEALWLRPVGEETSFVELLALDTDDRALEGGVEGNWPLTCLPISSTGSFFFVVSVSHGLIAFHRSDQFHPQSG